MANQEIDHDVAVELEAHHNSSPHQVESSCDEEFIRNLMASSDCSREDAEIASHLAVEFYSGKHSRASHDYRDAIGFIIAAPNPAIAAWGVAIASGFDACEGKSMDEIAQDLIQKGIPATKSALSKSAYGYAELFGLSKSRYQRSDVAQESYAERAREVHGKKQDATRPMSKAVEKAMKDADLTDIPKLAKISPTELSLKEGITEEELERVWAALKQCESSLQWWIGDTARQTKERLGLTWEKYAEKVGFAAETVRTYAYVADSVDTVIRITGVDFKHHQLVASLLPDQQRYWLKQVVDHNLTVKQLGYSISAGKVTKIPSSLPDYGVDSIESWTGALMQRWERNVFNPRLSSMPKTTLQRWAERLRKPHEYYTKVMEALNQ